MRNRTEYAKALEEDAEDFSIVDSYIPKEEVYSEKLETSTAPVIDILKYIPLFIVTTIAMAASIVFGNIIG